MIAAKDQDWDWLTAMDEALQEQLRATIEAEQREFTEAELEAVLTGAVATLTQQFTGSLQKRTPRMIRHSEVDTRAFERRNLKRWRPAFTAFEVVWKLVAEISGAFNSRYRPQAAADQDFRFEALSGLNARALLVARECMALMRAGLAEGALARWRTLHEVASTAVFLAQADNETALKYLLSFRFQAYQAALQVDACMGKGTRESFTDEELAAMRAECEQITANHGYNLQEEYEWARNGFTRTSLSPKKRITFRDIEQEVELQGFRPYYRWASQHNHAGYRPADKSLGLSESFEPLILIGPSNSGMVDPLQLVVMSLTKSAAVFLSLQPSLDTAVHLSLLQAFESKVGPIALATESKTKAAAERRRRRSHPPGGTAR